MNVEPTRFATYALCGALGGLNGALLAGYFRGANVDIGNEYLLLSIAVVVIGGTSVAGGKAAISVAPAPTFTPPAALQRSPGVTPRLARGFAGSEFDDLRGDLLLPHQALTRL